MPLHPNRVIKETLVLVLRHEHFVFKSVSLGLLEGGQVIVSATVGIFRFHNFVFVDVGLLILHNLTLENFWLCNRMELAVVILGGRRLLRYVHTMVIHLKLLVSGLWYL